MRLPFVITFEVGEGLVGTIAFPDVGAYELEFSEVGIEYGRLRFELETPIGAAVWEGGVHPELIEGEYCQAGVMGSFRMRRVREQIAKTTGIDEEVPYRDEEVKFASGDIMLTGSLSVPEGVGPHPAVVLVSGSGAQDRDANFYGFKAFAIIADHLARRSIAVLRFDDRGVGGSSGSVLETTLVERAEDVAAAVDILRLHADIDAERIGLVGHSEGGMIAPLVARERGDVAFLVLLAAPAVSGEVLLTEQVGRVMEAAGATGDEIEQSKARQGLILRAVVTDEGWDEDEATIRLEPRERIEGLAAVWRQAITDIDLYLDDLVKQQIAGVQSPWYRSIAKFDPAPELRELTVPMLALYGGLDTQVPPDINVPALAGALAESGNKDYTVTILPPANHLFQEAVTGSPQEYPQLPREFVSGFLNTLSEWILEMTGGRDQPPADKP